jgi:muramoyltetrapeptide carboxypeptidase LdcA involved in peptidoglycan recycling
MNKKLITPEKLKKGDTIAFVSPSAGLAPFAPHRIEIATKMLEKLGYKVKIASNAVKNNDYVSASPIARASDINKMFADKKVKMIMATIGGNHSNQILKYLDYNLIRKNPKIFIGYSDNTVLHFALQSQANLATYYGPCAMTQFGENPQILDYTLKYFNYSISEKQAKKTYSILPSETWTDEILNWFEKEDLKRPRKLSKNHGYEWLRPGKAKGPILGGAVVSLNHLAGTKYWLDPKDTIYFLDIPESSDITQGLSLSDVDSLLADLDNLNVFETIKGLIIGRPYKYSKAEEKVLKAIVMRYMHNKKCPILYNANIGHVDPIVTLRYGSTAILDSEQNKLEIING